jgi:hypothetical protein
MSNLKESPEKIAQRINNIIPYHEFNSNMVLWGLEDKKITTAKRLIKNTTKEERQLILQSLNTRGRLNYSRYFS